MTIVALISLLIILYTYLGYPVFVALLAHFRPWYPKPEPGYLPRVSVCIPVYNGSSYVIGKIESLKKQNYPQDKLEVLLYSDGSTDSTPALLGQLASADGRIRPIYSERRQGKPTALNAMREQAHGEVLVLTDIRQPLVPDAIRALVEPLGDPAVGAVSGNLVLQGAAGAGMYWRYENWIRESEGRFRGMIGVTGPIYALRREHLAQVPLDIILDDMWIPLRLCLSGRRVAFAKTAVATDDAFDDDREFGRKARTLAGNYQLFWRLPRVLLPFQCNLWFEIVSHKLLRLICPWVLALLFGSTVVASLQHPPSLATYATQLVLAGQLGVYLLALLGGRARGPGRLARTFVVMNWAAVVGLWRFVRGRQQITW